MAFKFRTKATRETSPANDYGDPAVRSNRLLRPLLSATHALHLISSLIVLGISAYFINNYTHNTHLVYWVALSSIDTFLHLPAPILPFLHSYKNHLAPLTWTLSYLWLTAFIFAAQDYEYNGGCAANSPSLVGKCGIKRALEAFAFLAFFTSLVGTVLEVWGWGVGRVGGGSVGGAEKQRGVDAAAAAAEPVVGAQAAAPAVAQETV